MRDGNQHDIHQPHAANPEREHTDEAQQDLDSDRDSVQIGQIFHRVKYKHRAFIFRIEVVVKGQRIPYCLGHLAVVPFVIERDCVKIIGVLDIAHRAIRHIDHRIHVVVAVGKHVLDDANNLIGNALNAHGFAQRVLSREQFLFHVGTQHGDAAVGEVFLLSKETAFPDFDMADLLVAGVCPPDVVVVAARPVGHQTLFVHFRRHALDHGNFCAEEIQILTTEANLCARLAAACLQRSSPGENCHQVAAKGLEGHHQCVLKTGPIRQQKYDGGNAPRHAQHGEQRAALVVAQRLVGLFAEIRKHGYSCRSASTGGSSAAFRAG